jgi:hypothetical protein
LEDGELEGSATAPKRNSKPEYRNPKQIPITQEENPKRDSAIVLDLGDYDFVIVSDFGSRNSDSPPVANAPGAPQLSPLAQSPPVTGSGRLGAESLGAA